MEPKTKKQILIVVDPQLAYFTADMLPVTANWTIDNIAAIATHFNGAKILIQHVAEDTPFADGTPGYYYHPALQSVIFHDRYDKSTASAIRWDLKAKLEWWQATHDLEIVIVGYQTHHCVQATAFDACDYGTVFVVSDACSSPDVGSLSGATMHAAALASMSQFYCKVIDTREAIKRFCKIK
jgi:nicotinamidase-related amidase